MANLSVKDTTCTTSPSKPTLEGNRVNSRKRKIADISDPEDSEDDKMSYMPPVLEFDIPVWNLTRSIFIGFAITMNLIMMTPVFIFYLLPFWIFHQLKKVGYYIAMKLHLNRHRHRHRGANHVVRGKGLAENKISPKIANGDIPIFSEGFELLPPPAYPNSGMPQNRQSISDLTSVVDRDTALDSHPVSTTAAIKAPTSTQKDGTVKPAIRVTLSDLEAMVVLEKLSNQMESVTKEITKGQGATSSDSNISQKGHAKGQKKVKERKITWENLEEGHDAGL